jgi:molecular chaperone Hsp33
MSETSPDRVVRALTDDGSFRVLTARTTGLCRGAVMLQGVQGVSARHFGDLLTGTVLVRETMAPQLRVQGIVRGAHGSSTLVADSFPDGGTRGLVTKAQGHQRVVLGGDALMQFMRTMPNGAVHRGVVKVPAEGGIASALMAYMQESEQILTVMGCATVLDDAGKVQSAGGYVVQLLPGADHDVAMVLTERLALDFADITSQVAAPDFDPDTLLDELLYRVEFSRVESRDVRFHCPCSHTTVLTSLATIDRADIQSFIDSGEVLDIACEYCRRDYKVSPEDLRGLLLSN